MKYLAEANASASLDWSELMRTYRRPFVSGMTFILLYPILAPFLKTVPNHPEGKVRLYEAFVALDVVNRLRQELALPTEEADKVPVS
jgi:hypothetical protein